MSSTKQLKLLVDAAQSVVVMQADNPDGDSLASALALEQILGDLGKEPFLYCGVDMPTYLRHLPGWDRVSNELPNKFDLSIIVDTSSLSLFGNLEKSGQKQWVSSKPCIVIDHHDVKASIPFATLLINEPVVATGQILYEIAQELDWPLSQTAKEMIATSIMSDSLGLVSEGTTARTIHIIGELVEAGVSLSALDDARRQSMRKHPSLLPYKGELLKRVEFHNDNRIATITIPWEEIERYSSLYNPSMLVLDEMRMVEGTDIGIAFKVYHDGKVTAKIRANYGIGIANRLAEHFGGGGHAYAAGFKITDGRAFNEIKADCIRVTAELLAKLDQGTPNEAVQHAKKDS